MLFHRSVDFSGTHTHTTDGNRNERDAWKCHTQWVCNVMRLAGVIICMYGLCTYVYIYICIYIQWLPWPSDVLAARHCAHAAGKQRITLLRLIALRCRVMDFHCKPWYFLVGEAIVVGTGGGGRRAQAPNRKVGWHPSLCPPPPPKLELNLLAKNASLHVIHQNWSNNPWWSFDHHS